MQDWRVFRPAIWMAMLGFALMLLISPVYFGVAVLGGAIGIALRIESGRRRARSLPPPRRRGRKR